jgi:hypothetical protein
MAEGDGTVYNNFKEQVLAGTIDLSGDSTGHTLKLILVTGHSLDIDNDAAYSDVSGDECSGTGYSAGGETLTSQALTQDNTNDLAKFDADNVTWSSLDVSGGGDPNYAILYDDDADDCLIAAWEIATATNGGDWTIVWNADGILTLS